MSQIYQIQKSVISDNSKLVQIKKLYIEGKYTECLNIVN